jgi:hypothetical protein
MYRIFLYISTEEKNVPNETIEQKREKILQYAKHIEDSMTHVVKLSPAADRTPNNSAVLMLGLTDVGKSTLINYFLGHSLIKWNAKSMGKRPDRRSNRVYLRDEVENFAVIGNMPSPETEYISSYSAPRLGTSPLRVFDTPGFLDDNETKMFSNFLALEHMLRKEEHIKAVIVIDYGSILVHNSGTFKKLVKELVQLFPPNELALDKYKEYSFALMSSTNVCEAKTIYLGHNEMGLQYQIITSKGVVINNTIAWEQLPSDCPQNAPEILTSQEKWLLHILKYISKAGHIQNNILFLINKAPDETEYPDIIAAIGDIQKALENEFIRQVKINSETELKLLTDAITLCSIIEQSPESQVILANPLDNGETRRLIFDAIDEMQAIPHELFTLASHIDYIKVIRMIEQDYIIPYLDIMRNDGLTYGLSLLTWEHRALLAKYKTLMGDARKAEIQKDSTEQKNRLVALRSDKLTELAVIESDSALKALDPDGDMVFATLSRNERIYTFLEKFGMASITAIGTVASVVSLAGFASLSVPIIIGRGILASMSISFPLIVIDKINSAEFTLKYNGPKFHDAEEDTMDAVKRVDGAWYCDFIAKKPDEEESEQMKAAGKYSVRFGTVVQGATEHRPQSAIVRIIGKRADSLEYGAEIANARADLAKKKNELTLHEQTSTALIKFIDVLEQLEAKPDSLEEAEESLIIDRPYPDVLKSIAVELNAVKTILTYVAALSSFGDFLHEYENLKRRWPKEHQESLGSTTMLEIAQPRLSQSSQTLFARAVVPTVTSAAAAGAQSGLGVS